MTAPPEVSSRNVKVLLALLSLLVAVGVVIVVMTDLESGREGALGESISVVMAFISFFGVGVAIVIRRARHPIGWLFLAMGSYPIAHAAIIGLGRKVAAAGGSDALTLLGNIAFSWPALVGTLIVFVPLLFPTGRLPSRNWRWLAWLAGATLAVIALGQSVQRDFCVSYDVSGACLTRLANPIGLAWMPDLEQSALGSVLLGVLLMCGAGAWISVVVRYRRSHGVERAQLRWFTFAISLFLTYMVYVGFVPAEVFHLYGALQAVVPLGIDPFGVFLSLVPLSVGVAILRYRLYDIDRLISRTISYGIITTILLATYAGAVFALRKVLPGQSDLAVVASTLAVAALFNPVRHRIQGGVDRRFNRSRYDTQQVVTAFGLGLRSEVGLDALSDGLVGVANETMQPETVSLWLKGRV